MTSKRLGIRYVDGRRFARALAAGLERLVRHAEHLDDINVFPVPDGDTGTNMRSTARHVAAELTGCRDRSIAAVTSIVSEAAILGARGNSGAILAEFFQGLREGLAGCERVDARRFGEAALLASRKASEAVLEPREGTILTVIREWARALAVEAASTGDFACAMRASLGAAEASLARTTAQLEVLRASGVVDAGAQGFVYVLQGAVDGRPDRGPLEPAEPAILRLAGADGHAAFHPSHPFCTEALVVGEGLDLGALRRTLSTRGDSLLVVGSPQRARVHIHTGDPAGVFDELWSRGTLEQMKVDDMRTQLLDVEESGRRTVALVSDSACDLTAELLRRYRVHTVPLRILFGERESIDKLTIDPGAFFSTVKSSPHHPKTSQPAPADFARTYELLARRYESIVSIHLTSRYSGTYSSARAQAARYGSKISVVDSRAISVGQGLLVREAARAIERGAGAREVVETLERARRSLRMLFVLDTLEFLVKGGRLGGVKGAIGEALGLMPILEVDDEGAFRVLRATKRSRGRRSLVNAVARAAGPRRGLRFALAHGDCPEAAAEVAQRLTELLAPEEILVTEVSPALGAHAGPGLVAVAFLAE